MKFIVTQDGDEVHEVCGSIFLIEPSKGSDFWGSGMTLRFRKTTYRMLGCYKTEAVAKGVFSSVLGFLNLNSSNLFYMPKDKE